MKKMFFILAVVAPMLLMGLDIKGFFSNLINTDELFVYGLADQPFDQGVYGIGEISPHVRVTVINGIMNDVESCMKTLDTLSAAHGGVNVHYVYWNSEGWTADIYKGFYSKIFGYLSVPARELANLWRRLIEEMGGVEGPGVIYHYAHSIGANETLLAAKLLTAEEKSKLHIVTLGPATIISPVGFASAINYISRRDAVSFLDPWNFYLAHQGSLPHAVVVGEFESIHPILEHHLLTGNYLRLLLEHGRQFIERYRSSKDALGGLIAGSVEFED